VGQAPAASTRRDLAGEYFDQLSARFELAAEGRPLVYELEIGGLRLDLHFAGEAMRDVLLAPFEHLVVSAGAPAELSISVFDAASSGVEAPAPAWEPVEAAPGTSPAMRLRSERACVLAATASGAVTAADPSSGRAVFYLPDAARISPIERAAPLREALQLLMAPRGRWMTHAGAVGRGGRGVLLVGRGGSGKSTLALSCALAGMGIVADDYVLLETGPPRAHAMQSTAKLTEDSADRLGLVAEAIDPAGFESTLEGPAKALVDIRALAPGRLKPQLEIAAIVVPHVSVERLSFAAPGAAKLKRSRGEPALEPISAGEGLRALAPSTIIQSGFHGAAALAALGGLVRQVPSYRLALSPDPTANARAIGELVSELG
jgi:hypothetical protein